MTLPTKIDAAQSVSRYRNVPSVSCGFVRGGDIFEHHFPDLVVSKQKLRRADAIASVRMKRQEASQNLGFASRPFVLCGLPVKRPQAGQLLHERRNGHFLLQVTGHPSYGLPWFQRIFGATIFFGTDTQRQKAMVVHQARFSFMTEARIWYSRHSDQETLPCEFQNEIVLSPEFFKEILDHPIPTDMEAAKALSCAPAALDLFTWLSYRCYVAKGRERVPLFGDSGLVSQLGSADYSRHRKFRERLDGWLNLVRAMWPECPAMIDSNGTGLYVDRANAVLPSGGNHETE